MTTLEDLFGDLQLDDSLWEKIRLAQKNEHEFRTLIAENPNLVVLAETISFMRNIDPEREEQPREFKAFLNLLKLLLLEFSRSPYWNSRIGWLMWFWSCYARYDSYYPMKWCFHYDPRNWYRHDEPPRPPGLEKFSPEDPYNIKGECFVHPEWYRKTTEHES
jgi:hypothetical protein